MKKIYVFFINVFILTLSSLIIQTVSISFNAYLSKKIGAEGIGLYHLIMSVYGLSVTVATSGIQLTVTRLVSEENALKNYGASRLILRKSMIYSLLFGMLSFGILFFNAELIGTRLLNDQRTIACIKILSLSMPFISASSVLNGYFTAVKQVIKTSAAQIFELAVKMITISSLLVICIPKGIEYACIAMFAGGVISEVISFAFLFALYLMRKKTPLYTNSQYKVLKRMLSIALPVAFSTYLRSILNTIKQIIVPKGLRKSGLSYKSALENYGIINGMVMPVIAFPMNILYSCSNLLVPELSECAARGNTYQIKRIVSKALKTTTVFAVLVFIFCTVFSEKIGMNIYGSTAAGRFIKILSPIILTMYIDAVADGILKGLNQQLYSMKYNIADSAISIVLLLVLLPKWGIYGYIAVIYVSEILNTTLSVKRLIKVVFR